MSDGDKPNEWVIPHVEASQFRSVFANGAIFTTPPDGTKNWILTFYSEGAKIVSETLVSAGSEGLYTIADPPQIETQRIRRDEVSVMIPESQLVSMMNAILARIKSGAT